jgi:universal stress protein E
MDKINRILVANDSLEGLQTALAKAELIEHFTGAEVEVAEVVWNHIEEEALPEENKIALIGKFVDVEQQKLDKLLAPYAERIAWSEARVIWNKRANEAIAEEVKLKQADLLIKPLGTHHGIADFIATPLDWKVLRSAPCPVLISKSQEWASGGNVLAAVDMGDRDHTALSEAVLETAATMSRVLDAQLHVVCAYPDLGQAVNDYQVAMDYDGIKEDMREARESALTQMLSRLGIEPAETYLQEGKPGKVIKQTANRLDATVTVVGTAARSAFSKIVIGNTSEDVLNQLDGDILTVHAS